MNNVKFTGVMPALVTPLNADETINEAASRKLMQWLLSEGMDGFYLCGGTGEGPVVQKSERKKLAEIAREETQGKGDLIVHVGAVDLKTAAELAEHAGKIGADAISSVPPFFFQYGEAQIKQYYTALAEASGLPVIMYASPLAGVNITWDMVDRLMDIPGMIGLKWTSNDYYTMRRIKELRGGNINVLNGPDELLLCGMTMGADGGIGATYNIMPRLFRAIYDGFKSNNMDEARKAQVLVDHMVDVLIKYGVVPAIKEILAMMGHDCGYCVYPTKRLSDDERKALRKDLDDMKFEEVYLNY